MKYTIEMTGWEYNIQTKSLDADQSEQARRDIDNLSELADLHINGEGDIDLIGGLIFKSKVLTGELESGKHKGTYMNLYTSEGENVEIYD